MSTLADGHVEYVCTKPCKPYCMFCEGGLFLCKRCGGFEGSLPSQCPGVKMTQGQEDAVYAGTLDFRNGTWVNAPSGSVASHYDGRPGLPEERS